MPNRAEPDWNSISNSGYIHPFTDLSISKPNINNFSEWRNPETWKISLSELESILNNRGLNPELPDFYFDVRYDLTNLPEFDLSNNTASLLSNVSEGDAIVMVNTGMEDTVFIEGLTIPNSKVTQSISLSSNITPSVGPSRIPQIAAVEDKFIEITANDLTVSPVTVNEASTKITSFHDSILHIAPDQLGNTAIPPLTTGEIAVSEPTLIAGSISLDVDGLKANTVENSSRKIGSDKFNPIQADVLQNNTSEISFASSIPPEQFFSIHNSTPQIINRLNNSATNIWSDLLQSQSQLDINFQITDLSTGQLAEATITGFDENGVPNAGKILIDHDANGIGWFVDETPLDNSEFSVVEDKEDKEDKGEYYLLAAAESEASGKYDLLTAVLHEMAHLYGFIDGYTGFDANIETENGTTKFIGDDFTATLDGEHLDKQAHPYDLLNTHLAPGMRKLPSELDVEILQAILSEKAGGRRQGDKEKLEAALTSDPYFAGNNDFSFGGRRVASTLVHKSLPETRLGINSVLPTLQSDRSDDFIPNSGLSSQLLSGEIAEIETSGVSAFDDITTFSNIDNFTIGHDSILEDSFIYRNNDRNVDRTNKVSVRQISPSPSVFKISSNQTSSSKINSVPTGRIEIDPSQVSSTEVSTFKMTRTPIQ